MLNVTEHDAPHLSFQDGNARVGRSQLKIPMAGPVQRKKVECRVEQAQYEGPNVT